MALAAVGLLIFPVFYGLWTYIPLGFASIGLGMFRVASIVEFNEKAPYTLKGAISGSYYLFWSAGYVLGPLAIGAISSNVPYIGFETLVVLLGVQALALGKVRN